jgi:hypothetical protein
VGNNHSGAAFYTRNLMSTLRGTGLLLYNSNKSALDAKVYLTYAALYLVFDLKYGVYTRRRADINRLTHEFLMSRGYLTDPFGKIRVTLANYEFLRWYPDLAFGWVAFLQRLRTNLFYDYSQVNWNAQKGYLHATGTELFTDLRVFRLFSMTMNPRIKTNGRSDTHPGSCC